MAKPNPSGETFVVKKLEVSVDKVGLDKMLEDTKQALVTLIEYDVIRECEMQAVVNRVLAHVADYVTVDIKGSDVAA